MNRYRGPDASGEEDRLGRLLLSVSDGTAIDWEEAERECRDEDERRLLRSLHIIAGVSGFHADPAAPFRPGGRWAHLEIGERIGQGAWGQVYRAHDSRLRRDVAVKFLSGAARESGAATTGRSGQQVDTTHRQPMDRGDFPAAGDSFLEEARRLAGVRHPNVVQVHSVETAEDPAGGTRDALVLEYIRGRTLAELVRDEGRRGAAEVIATGVELCRALAAVHGAGLVHQDLKAQNVMREEGGRIVLMDFAQGGATPLYMAPELFHGSPPSRSTDLYSAGVLLFHLATGSFPVSGRDLEELRAQHARGVRARLRDARPDFPPDLVEALERALAADPAKRFSTAGEMERALAGCLFSTPSRVPGRVPSPVPSPSETNSRPGEHAGHARRSTLLWSFLGLTVLAMATLVGVFAFRNRMGGRTGQTTGAPLSAPLPAATAAAPLPYTIEAGFWNGRGQRTRLREGSRIAPGDSISLSLRSSGEVYVYVIDQDEHGEAYLLFPAPEFLPQNPLPSGATHILPGSRAGGEAYWRVTSPGGRERLLVIASPRRLDSLERQVATLNRPQKDAPVRYARVPREQVADELRGLGGYVERKPEAQSASPPSDLFELAEGLPPGPEDARGVWIRKLELENPPQRQSPAATKPAQ